jgi:hypothetical protein
MPREEANDFGGQRSVLVRVRAFAALLPRVEATTGDAVSPTERGDGVPRLLRTELGDEGEAFAFRALQNRDSFF